MLFCTAYSVYIYKISRYKLTSRRRDGGPFRTAWVRSANEITRLDNKEIQNKNKRPQWVLDEGGPLSKERLAAARTHIWKWTRNGCEITKNEKKNRTYKACKTTVIHCYIWNANFWRSCRRRCCGYLSSLLCRVALLSARSSGFRIPCKT